MSFKAAKCPNCAGELQLPEDRDSVKCMYCGSDIVVREAIKLAGGVNIENLLQLAEHAEKCKQYAEAYNYYSKILETDANNYRAWYGKAISAGRQSTLANLRIQETISGIENALKCAPENEKDELKVKAASSLRELAIDIFFLGAEKNPFTSEFENFNPQMSSIVAVLEIASSYRPDDRSILDNIVFVIQASGLTKYPFLSDHKAMSNKIQEVEKKIQQLDPAYVPKYRATEENPPEENPPEENPPEENPPQKTRKRVGGTEWYVTKYRATEENPPEENPPPAPPLTNKTSCFIATAAYGSAMEAEVVILQQFRDHCLKNTPVGEAFITGYYRLSPPIADIISRNDSLRAMTRFLLKPLMYLIKRSRPNLPY